MAFDTIRVGIKVFTSSRIGRGGGVRGGIEGVVDSVIRHPISRDILAVIVDPGTGDPEDRVVVRSRWLRQAQAA